MKLLCVINQVSLDSYIFIYKYNVMENATTQLTSVKVDKDLFDEFKVECVRRKFSLNKLVNRAMDLYLKDESFRKQVTNYNLKITE